jgi:hypothetical protein
LSNRAATRPVELSVYDGRHWLGTIRKRGKHVAAYAVEPTTYSMNRVGVFKTQRDAMRAIPTTNDKPARGGSTARV